MGSCLSLEFQTDDTGSIDAPQPFLIWGPTRRATQLYPVIQTKNLRQSLAMSMKIEINFDLERSVSVTVGSHPVSLYGSVQSASSFFSKLIGWHICTGRFIQSTASHTVRAIPQIRSSRCFQTHFARIRLLNLYFISDGLDLLPTKTLRGSILTKFMSKNVTEADEAWDLVGSGHGDVAIEPQYAFKHGLPPTIAHPKDDRKLLYIIAAYHAIHCIVSLPSSLSAIWSVLPTHTVSKQLPTSVSYELKWLFRALASLPFVPKTKADL